MIILVLAATIGLGIWLLIGSPTEMQAIIALAMFVGTSGIMLLKYIFVVDKKATVGFIKVKHDIDKFRIEVKNRFNNIDTKLNEITRKL